MRACVVVVFTRRVRFEPLRAVNVIVIYMQFYIDIILHYYQ